MMPRNIETPASRRAFLRGVAAAGAGAAAIAAAGCGGGDDGPASATPSGSATPMMDAGTPGASAAFTPNLLTSEYVVNQNNRFVVGLLDAKGNLLKDAKVHARFFTVGEDSKGTFRGEGDLDYFELNVAEAHAHDKSAGDAASHNEVSFYVATTPFDEVGKWGAEITATPSGGGAASTVQVPFEVLATSKSPGLGTKPPASVNDTAATNTNTSSLCSRDPICPLHDKVIADVLGKGRPLVVQFSTPAFCESRFCGPVLEVLLAQVPKYRDRIDFVHIEVWQDFQAQVYRQAVREWNLPTEPYTFFMGSDGTVLARIEAIFSDEELTRALDQLAAR